MKKKLIIGVVMAVLTATQVLAYTKYQLTEDIFGKWTGKTSNLTVMDIIPDKNNNECQIFITKGDKNSDKKEIFRFRAKDDSSGFLKYENGLHIYKDKLNYTVDYKDGSGTISIKDKEILWIDNKNSDGNNIFAKANKKSVNGTTVKNDFISITLPEELKDLYTAEIKKDRISLYDKASKKAGFGGFAFGLGLYKNPADYAMGPGVRKLGELKDKQGELYDVVIIHPTDVQYDYTKGTEAPEAFKLLYDIGDTVHIKGINNNKYFKGQGTKGEELYPEILKKHIKAIKEKTDSKDLENQGMSYMYKVLANGGAKVLDKVGYAYYDINGDGIDELVIGEISKGNWKGVIYDIYTMVNREPKHVASGGSRNRYFVCDYHFLCNEYSSGAKESGTRVYILLENSIELFPQVSFKYDGYTNKKQPWFISYATNVEKDEWENVTEKKFKERKAVFDRYQRFDFTPLSKLKF